MLEVGPALKVTIHLNRDTGAAHGFLVDEILAFLQENGVEGATAVEAHAGYGTHRRLHKAGAGDVKGLHLPVIIYFVEEQGKFNKIRDGLLSMVSDGLVEAHPTHVLKSVSSAQFPPGVTAIKLAVAIAIGLLIGFERQWSNKDFGVRTFSFTSLLGALTALMPMSVMLISLAGIIALAVVLNLRDILVFRSVEGTTSLALIVTFILGALSGQGHIFTSTASGIVVTWFLSLKPQFRAFAGGVNPQEIHSALLLGLFGFVIWPLLPIGPIDRWSLIYPREAWVTVLIVASIGFLNYILLRGYGAKGISLTAILGGLVNSTATAAELSSTLPKAGLVDTALSAVLLTSVAMFARNLLLLAIFAPHAVIFASVPLAVMAAIAVWSARRARSRADKSNVDLNLESPVSLLKVGQFAFLFVGIQILGTLATRALGSTGLFLISMLGGLVSSASTTTAAAILCAHGRISPIHAAVATVLTSIVSTSVNLPVVYKNTEARPLARNLFLATAAQLVAGVVAILAQALVIKRIVR